MKKKSKDFMIYFDDNGVAKYYDDTYDITIHCESEEEQRATLERIRSKRWVPCSERLPEINQTVLLSTTDGEVIVGYRYKPDIVWQVTANDGRRIWVYDPENYPGNIDELPKAETCGFENKDNCWLSITSINYDLKFAGISAWMPMPEPYKEEAEQIESSED